ncbi:hypothetical protein MJA45_20385 [Paenibacillus aurantius]|uniref:DZANK-type domain-containing protein n=1 Tax=Paenibacillus aurantius TaxID=2918900 RepID=A0AA96LD83_9BACL|nr:hypothetical protein [Paenibacillus aurantius]WNQ09961.1 hypothetical protein MJA45_20385 [Paenibacillus aurantius]
MADPRTCIRCKHQGEPTDKFCVRCAAPLINNCTHKGDIFTKKCERVNREDAAFCSGCGAPTVFHKEGFVQGYSNVQVTSTRRP